MTSLPANDLEKSLALMDAGQLRGKGRFHHDSLSTTLFQCCCQGTGAIMRPGDRQVASAQPVSDREIVRRLSTEECRAGRGLNGEPSIDYATVGKEFR